MLILEIAGGIIVAVLLLGLLNTDDPDCPKCHPRDPR